jgi:hypothetical protein
MRRPALRWFSLSVLAVSAAAIAQPDAPLTYRAINAMTPAAVGRRLLGRERGADIVRVEFLDFRAPAGRFPGLLQLLLYTRPVPLGPTYCSQRRYYHALASAVSREHRPLRRGEPLRILSSWDQPMFARAPGCRLAPGQLFASVRDGGVAMRALDDLASAQAAANSANGTIPLQLTCRDEVEDDPDRCGAGAREVLAHLPLDHACYVENASGDRPDVDVYLCTDGPQWVLHQLMAGSDPPRLLMVWKYPDGGY